MSLEEIMNIIFGGQIDVSKITTILVAIFALIKSITEWRAKVKLIKSEKEVSTFDERFAKQESEMKNVNRAISTFSDMLLTAYLSNNAVPEDIKKKMAICGETLNHIAGINLADDTKKIIEVVQDVAPVKEIEEHKEDILQASQKTEEIIDDANKEAQSAIDKIRLS